MSTGSTAPGFPKPGGCACGAVRYDLLGPPLSLQHCHCSRCRKGFGVLCAQGAVIRKADLSVAGQEHLTVYEGSPGFAYHFCSRCGCRLFAYEERAPELMYLMAATLDGGVDPGHPPEKEAHIWVGSKAEWDRIGDDLPQFGEASPDEIVTGIMRGD